MLSPGLFRRLLVRLIPSFWLGLYLDGEDHPVFLRTCWGFLPSALAGMYLLPYPGAYSALEWACWGGAWFGVAPGRELRLSLRWLLWASTGFLLWVSLVLYFLPPWASSRRRVLVGGSTARALGVCSDRGYRGPSCGNKQLKSLKA